MSSPSPTQICGSLLSILHPRVEPVWMHGAVRPGAARQRAHNASVNLTQERPHRGCTIPQIQFSVLMWPSWAAAPRACSRPRQSAAPVQALKSRYGPRPCMHAPAGQLAHQLLAGLRRRTCRGAAQRGSRDGPLRVQRVVQQKLRLNLRLSTPGHILSLSLRGTCTW